jgi:hypothetical protein
MSKALFFDLKWLRLAAALCALALIGPNDAKSQNSTDTRQQVWKTGVARLVKEPPGWDLNDRHETQAVAFSRDDRWLAVTVVHERRLPDGGWLSLTHLLVVDVRGPDNKVLQFDLAGTCGEDLAWNETGAAVLVCGRILRLADGTSCGATRLPETAQESGLIEAYWLDDDHVVRSDTGTILNLDCDKTGNWRMDPGWQIGAVAASKRRLLLWHHKGKTPNTAWECALVDLDSHSSPPEWPGLRLPCSWPLKASAGAEALCFNPKGGKLHCWSILSGRELSLPKQVREYTVTESSANSPRVIAERWQPNRGPWWESLFNWWVPVPGFPELPQLRAAFDLRSSGPISAWRPRIQESSFGSFANRLYLCALSSHGDLLAESGDGAIELYRFSR